MSLNTRRTSAGFGALPRFQLNRLSMALCSCLLLTFSSTAYAKDWSFDRDSKWSRPEAPIIGGDHVTISNGATLTFDFVNDLDAKNFARGVAQVVTTHYDLPNKDPSSDVLIEGSGKIRALAKSPTDVCYGIATFSDGKPAQNIQIRGIDLEFENFHSGIRLFSAGKTEITDSNVLIKLEEGKVNNWDTVRIFTAYEGNSLTIGGKSSVDIREYDYGISIDKGSVAEISGNRLEITRRDGNGKKAVGVKDAGTFLSILP